MIAGRALAFACLAALLASPACKSSDDAKKEPIQIGFAPPTAAPAVTASTTATAAAPSPVFTSFFHDVDAAPATPESASASAKANVPPPPDPDAAAMEAVRSRANACFPQANLAKGQTRAVTLTFHVLATGRVSTTDISGASSKDGGFYSCLQSISNSATFPEKPDAGTDVRTLSVTAQATAS